MLRAFNALNLPSKLAYLTGIAKTYPSKIAAIEKRLNEAEKVAVSDIDAANELLSYGTKKLADSISSSALDQQGVKVASLTVETAKVN